ncbi:MAG: hypothetical protein U9M98_03690 [Patescibacteria group bacterium]|nr:hypothetical protein [Patescibacteria group bacterium]
MNLKQAFLLGLTFGIFPFLIFGAGRVNAALVIDNFGNLIYQVEGDVLAQPFETPPGLDRADSAEEDLEEDEDGETSDSAESAPGQQKSTPRERIILREAPPGLGSESTSSARSNIIKLQHAKDNRLKVQEIGGSEESTSSAELEVEDHWLRGRTTIRSDGVSYEIIRNRTAAKTHFPLSVNLNSNELIVTTPSGEKVVTVLPDEAVENMLAANVLDQIGGKGALNWLETTLESTPTAEESTPASSLEATEPGVLTEGAGESEIELTQTSEGVLAYEIPGIKQKKLFGLFDVTLDRVVVVSAETGELLGVRESLIQRLVSILSVG